MQGKDIQKKRIAILGSTGSIGRQSLEVIDRQSDYLEVEVLTAHSNSDLLIEQSLKYFPNVVVIVDESKYDQVFSALNKHNIKVFAGANSLGSVVTMDTIDLVLTGLVGYAGLHPTIEAIKAGKNIALANKETLVVAGELITNLAKEYGVNILPVDSEHSAIFQCIVGELHNPIEKIVLTASGGPFRGKDSAYLKNVSKEEALQHPNWDMGSKVTIDSATLMNKGLEVIEAKWLFGVSADQVQVVVHPQSIIHSIVQFEDGSMKAQMGLPDMRLPIQYALGYPKRFKSDFPRFDFLKYPELTFEKADRDVFKNLDLAYYSLKKGGNMPCVLNASNEIAVEAFLQDEISFLQISDIVETCLEKSSFISTPVYDDYVETDIETRVKAKEIIEQISV